MARRITKADLQADIDSLRPYQELFFINMDAQRWGGQHKFKSPKEARVPTNVTLHGPLRSSGGVIVEDCTVTFAEGWASRALTANCLYRQAIGRAVIEAIRNAHISTRK